MNERTSFEVAIVGAGAGGLSVASRLVRHLDPASIVVIDPAQQHYYQPLWTLVGGGLAKLGDSVRPQSSLMPDGVQWIQESVTAIAPDTNTLTLKSGRTLTAKQIVLAPGMEIFWDRIAGLSSTLGHNGVSSNYSFETVGAMAKILDSFTGGTALFTMPNTPVKCGGAPQKIMWIAEDLFRRRGLRDRSRVVFATAGASLFAVEKYRRTLDRLAKERGVELLFGHNLVAIDGLRKTARFDTTQGSIDIAFDIAHVSPPMGAPLWLRASGLTDAAGFIEVDKGTLRHVRHPDIYALGDASSLPTSRTAAAVRKQAPVLVDHLLSARRGGTSALRYDGYTSCPIVTGKGKLVLAEFDYEMKPRESFPFDQSKERLSMYWLKKYALPKLYWDFMLKGKA